MMKPVGRRAWWKWAGLGLVVAAVLGMGTSAVMFSRWTEITEVTARDAEQAFEAAIASAGGGPAYIEIADGVRARRDLERTSRTELETLHVLSWDPEKGRLVAVDLPFWFVRMKTTDSLNLGTLTAALTKDWQNLDLEVTVEDLERLGRGLVLDHVKADGARVLLWTEEAR